MKKLKKMKFKSVFFRLCSGTDLLLSIRTNVDLPRVYRGHGMMGTPTAYGSVLMASYSILSTFTHPVYKTQDVDLPR